ARQGLRSRHPVSPLSGTFLDGLQGSRGASRRASGQRKRTGQAMPNYEHVFLARQDVTSQQVEALTAQYKGVIEANGGSVSKSEYWGVKSLQYRIKKSRKAHFSLLNIVAPSAAIAEMERQM